MKARAGSRRPRHLLSDAAGGLISFIIEAALVVVLGLVALLIATILVLLV